MPTQSPVLNKFMQCVSIPLYFFVLHSDATQIVNIWADMQLFVLYLHKILKNELLT